MGVWAWGHAIVGCMGKAISHGVRGTYKQNSCVVDFRKAFDHVDYNLLISKLLPYDIPHCLIRWVHSYLSHRRQRVRINSKLSAWTCLFGVMRQGSWLGPFTFLVLINALILTVVFINLLMILCWQKHCLLDVTTHTHTQLFYGPFSGTTLVTGARRSLLDFMVQRKIHRGSHTDHRVGRHSIRTNQCPPPPSSHFLQAGCPFCLPTNSVKALKATSTSHQYNANLWWAAGGLDS